jgi:hypothetical protein
MVSPIAAIIINKIKILMCQVTSMGSPKTLEELGLDRSKIWEKVFTHRAMERRSFIS